MRRFALLLAFLALTACGGDEPTPADGPASTPETGPDAPPPGSGDNSNAPGTVGSGGTFGG